MISPFALHVTQALAARDVLWLQGPACGRVPEPGDELFIQAPLCPPVGVVVQSLAGTPRSSTGTEISLGVSPIAEFRAAQYVGGHVVEEGSLLTPFSARLRTSRSRGRWTVRIKVAKATKWGFAEVRSDILVLHIINGHRIAPLFWPEFQNCVFDDRTPTLNRDELSPIDNESSGPIFAIPVLAHNGESLVVRSIGPVLEEQANIVMENELESVRVYQQPTGLIQFRVPNSEMIEAVLLAAA